MTAVIHHGPPGSYKTFTLVQRVLIPALIAGRVVVTNIRGFNSIEKIRESLKIQIPDTAQILYLEPDDVGYSTIAKFFHWAPAGALIAMDEGQRVYPMRIKSFSHLDQSGDIVIHDQHGQPLIDSETNKPICRPSTLENAIDQHRHFNWDIYISTPNISKIHGEIRKCVEWGYRHRDNTGLLPWYKNTWSEFRHDAEQSGKSIAHYSGTPKRYKADFKYFQCYQSTATGTTKTSNENISVFRDPKLRALFALLLCCAFYFFYAFGDAYDRIVKTDKMATQETDQFLGSDISQVPSVSSDFDNHRFSNKARLPPPFPVNPIADFKLYFTGSINSFLLFEVEFPDFSTISLDINQLRAFGYTMKSRSGSFIVFDLNGRTVYALPKPRAPISERVASIERNAKQSSALDNPFN